MGDSNPALNCDNTGSILSEEKRQLTTTCHSCGKGEKSSYIAMTRDEVDAHLQQLSSKVWCLSSNGDSISRSFVCRNFKAALAVINAAGDVAENLAHHPDLHLTNYRNVEIRIFTHAVNGLTVDDFKLASALDAISIDYSPKWLKEHPEAM